MTANSILEYILVFFGWMLNNAMWDILSSTGLYLLPLVFKGMGIWLKVREEGFDEGNKGMLSLPRLENSIYVSFLVICFCCTPMFPVDISTMKYDSSRDKQCNIQVASPQDSGYNAVLTDFQGKTANVPVWWYLVHRLSKGVTQAMIASIPCGGKIRQMRFEVQHSQIKDPILTQELQDFANSCYSRAYYKLKSTNQSLSNKTINSVGWIGSDYFLRTAGYYNTYTSQKPRAAWPWDAGRDTGYANTGDGGYPTCKQWWSDDKKGLKDRVLASLPSRVKRQMQQQDMASWEELALRWLVTGQQDLPAHRRIPQVTFSKTVRYWHRFERWLAQQLQEITQHCYQKLKCFVANCTTEPRPLREFRGEYGSLRLFVGPQDIDEIDILEFNPEYIVSWVDKVADGLFTPVCFVVNVHYRNGALLESFPWDSEVDDINRLTSKDYGEAMSQAINWIREQTEQPVIDQPVPQQPRLAA
ncbi:hypothetical protein GCY28_24415 [Salmonella enterica subsp. enterica]|nr:hypothetical protein [Salmonella enterica subsp. enterica]